MNQDLEHLKLLSIFHYVVAGMVALFACIPLIHFFVGLALLIGTVGGDDPEATLIGVLFMVFAGIIILVGWTFAGLILFAGRNLARRTRYTYCLVIGAVECMFMPFGTVLGVFTIVVLMRESVKAAFLEANRSRPDQPVPSSA